MTTELERVETRALTPAQQAYQGLQTVRSVLAPDLTDAELRLFAMVATRSGLDPFAKQIYAVKRKGRVTFQTGIDGYRSIAERTREYDGQDEPEYGPVCDCGDARPAGHPESATVRVWRKGMSRGVAATAYWHEYKPAMGDKDRPQDAMWVRMPRVMLAKVAEALALRKAFPWDPTRGQGIGGDLYTAEEMAQADRPAPVVVEPVAGPRERLAARRAAVEAPEAEPLPEPLPEPPVEPMEAEPETVEHLPSTSAEFVAFVDRHGIASDVVRATAKAMDIDPKGITRDEMEALAVRLLAEKGAPE